MTKIIIPKDITTKIRSVEVEEGDLMLILTDHMENSFAFGIFEDVKIRPGTNPYAQNTEENRITLKPSLILKTQERFGHVVLPCFAIYGGKIVNREGAYRVNRGLLEVYCGQNEIVTKLKNTKGFEAHAEWISRLVKPYIIEQKPIE